MPEYLGEGLGGPFSLKEPWLRLYWDATAIDVLMRDPYGYVFEVNGGWRTREPQPALTFGDLYGRIRQFYDVKRSEGVSREETLRAAVRYANELAIIHNLEEVKTYSARADIEKRSSESLVRSIVWYDAQYGRFDPVKYVTGADGKALTETHFIVPLPFFAPTGEQYHLCGYLDGVVEHAGDTMPLERKHTLHELSDFYFAGYETSTQIRGYLLIAWLHFTQGKAFQSDLMIDATQFGLSPGRKETKHKPAEPAIPYVHFRRKVFTATCTLLDEWLSNLEYWIKHVAELNHALGYHEPAFGVFRPWSPPGQSLFTRKDGTGGSAFKRAHLQDPMMREGWMRQNFTQREPWNPTIEREKF